MCLEYYSVALFVVLHPSLCIGTDNAKVPLRYVGVPNVRSIYQELSISKFLLDPLAYHRKRCPGHAKRRG